MDDKYSMVDNHNIIIATLSMGFQWFRITKTTNSLFFTCCYTTGTYHIAVMNVFRVPITRNRIRM